MGGGGGGGVVAGGWWVVNQVCFAGWQWGCLHKQREGDEGLPVVAKHCARSELSHSKLLHPSCPHSPDPSHCANEAMGPKKVVKAFK